MALQEDYENTWKALRAAKEQIGELKEALAQKELEIARIKAFAAGRGMVSEAADMSEVAVLVVGLHERIAALVATVTAESVS